VPQASFLVDLDGGVIILRGARVQGLGGLALGWNLGKLMGWPGLFLKLDLDLMVGSSPLGAEYVMFDFLGGFLARIPTGPVVLRVEVAFGLRHLAVTHEPDGGSVDPRAGFGPVGGAGLEVPLNDWFSLQLGADVRYMRDPLTRRFEVSAGVRGGLGFSF
jgi:hypothetical protein